MNALCGIILVSDAYRRKEADFDVLMGIKIGLAQELQAYTNLLEMEEQRLGIRPKSSTASTITPIKLTASTSAELSSELSIESATSSSGQLVKKRKLDVASVSASVTASTASLSTPTAASAAALKSSAHLISSPSSDQRSNAALILAHVDLEGRVARLRNTTIEPSMLSLLSLSLSRADHVDTVNSFRMNSTFVSSLNHNIMFFSFLDTMYVSFLSFLGRLVPHQPNSDRSLQLPRHSHPQVRRVCYSVVR
jgi:hypothetical protein